MNDKIPIKENLMLNKYRKTRETNESKKTNMNRLS